MSKLQFLNVFLTDRLNLAAQEIFKAVEDIFSEYNEEICRSRKEIEVLRRRLQQAGLPLDSETQSSSNGTRDTPAFSEEQLRCEEDKKDAEVQIKLELYTEEEKNEVQTSVCNGSTSVLPCLDADDDQMACKDIEAQMMDNSENDFPSFIYQDVQIKNEPELHAESGSTCQAQHFTRHSSDDPGLPFRDQEMLTQHRMELDEINERMSLRIHLHNTITPVCQSPVFQDDVSKAYQKKLDNARRSKAWRDLIRQDPVKYAEYKALEAARAREYRRRKSAAAHGINWGVNNERQRRFRFKTSKKLQVFQDDKEAVAPNKSLYNKRGRNVSMIG